MPHTKSAFAIGATLPFLMAALAAAPAAAQDEGIAIGATPQPPVIETLDGEPADMAEIIGGRPAVIEFWATWCTICAALEPRIRAAHDAYGDRVAFLVVAVGVAQDPAGIRRHVARRPVAGRLLWDGRGRAARAYEAPGTGYIVILDEDGSVAYTGTGIEQDIMGALERVVGGVDGG